MTVVILMLGVALLLATGLFMLAFLDVAFHEPQLAVASSASRTAWRPPAAEKNDLMAWAALTAKKFTRNILTGRRDAALAHQLGLQIEEGTSVAAERSPQRTDWVDDRCELAGERLVGLTAPEVFEVADHLRRSRTTDQLQIFRRLAHDNAATLAADTTGTAEVPCALRCSDGQCAVQSCRPIQCRTECPLASAGSDGAQLDSHARTVGQGVAQGLSSALTEAGLDGRRYELNSALEVALSTPDAADRWAHGEYVFAGCQSFEV
ncbi:hypothetical protein GC176_15215 [bacterium]|nr:hypothetical protein [bacterium]